MVGPRLTEESVEREQGTVLYIAFPSGGGGPIRTVLPLFGHHVMVLRTNEKAPFFLTNQNRFALIWAARAGSQNQ